MARRVLIQPSLQAGAFDDGLKRAIDLVLAVPALIVLTPVLLAVGLWVRLDSPGPALFRQTRVGRGGRPFTCLKFRTMVHRADETRHREAMKRMVAGERMSADEAAPYKLSGDDRITRAGRWLRRSSVDELPQLVNVIRGDMSLVGPRPAIPYELEDYAGWHHLRHSVKPGITGLWQVYGRGRLGFEDTMAMDVSYATTHSVWLDLRLILLTIPVLLMQRGAR